MNSINKFAISIVLLPCLADASPAGSHSLFESRHPFTTYSGWNLGCNFFPTTATHKVGDVSMGQNYCYATGPAGAGVDTIGIDLFGSGVAHYSGGPTSPSSSDGSDSWPYAGETHEEVQIYFRYADDVGTAYYDSASVSFAFWYQITGNPGVVVYSTPIPTQINRRGNPL